MKMLILSMVCAIVMLAGMVGAAGAMDHDPMQPEPMPCWNCGGSGACPGCGGSGTVVIQYWDVRSRNPTEETVSCAECNGSGQCQTCFDSGMM